MTGQLDSGALAQSFSEVVRRHEVLRTTFKTIDGKATQVVSPATTVKIGLTDLSQYPTAEREAEARRVAAAEASLAFNLEQGPLLRTQLLRLNADVHILLVTMHHIISDAWSMELLVREVSTLYEAYLEGGTSPLPELEIQYADYAVWQREWLQGPVLEQQLVYWRKQLADAPTVLEMPTDHPRPAVRTNRGAHFEFSLSEKLSVELKELTQQEDLTLFMSMLAAFQVLLSRYSGQTEVVVGTPIANRSQSETEGLIGFFTNTLALRSSLGGDPIWRQLLARVREVCLGAYGHQEVPFERLVEELHPERNLGQTPLFQVMLIVENASAGDVELKGLKLNGSLATETHTAKFDLTLALKETPDGLHGVFEYRTDLFEQKTIIAWSEQFQRLLKQMVLNPDQRISLVQLLSEEERTQLVYEWNQTGREYPRVCVHQLFEAQAERTPAAPAVSFEGQELSYGELNRRSNQLAHYLRKVGVTGETLVGVFMERSLEMVIALFGVLKAGGAYVPLDPQYPKDRLSFTIKDAQMASLLTQGSLTELLPACGAEVIQVDNDWHLIASESELTPPSEMTPADLAYVIYTSGSTGVPKGVAIAHQSTTTMIHWAQETFAPSALRGVLASTSLCFDLSVFELFVPLSSGGTVFMVENALALPDMSAREAVTLINTVPSAMAELVRQGALPASVEVVNLAGEALGRGLVEAVYEQLPEAAVYNLYGPTEDTTYSTATLVARGEARAPAIGRPIANTEVYVLDQWGELAPVGVAGELCLGGAGLARGYWQRPELTAERFIPNPFSEAPGRRLYRTGDLVRYLADGELEYLGRLDQQVKVRGHRIELGEIEAVLGQHERVRQSVVIARADAPGQQRLVAYVVNEGEPAVSAEELRSYLRKQLPEYMLPAFFVTLAELPLTPNGKVDRQRLPAAAPGPSETKEYLAPRTAAEQILTDIWSEVLRVKRVGIHDNFFELGGDSILSIQVISRANQAGLQLIPLQLFENQSIASLASVAAIALPVRAEQGVISGTVELTPSEHWFFEQDLIDRNHYHQAVMLEVAAGFDALLMDQAVGHLVLHHDALRLRFQAGETEGSWNQTNAAAEEHQVFEVRKLRKETAAKREQALNEAEREVRRSLDFEHGPLLRVVYFELGDEEAGRMLLVIHRLAVDEVSWRIVLADLGTAYEQLRRGEAVKFAPKTSSYQEWARGLVEYAGSGEFREELGYWTDVCRQQVKKLPIDIMGAAESRGGVATVTTALDPERTRVLVAELGSVYHTRIEELLLTALAEALRKWSGTERLLIELAGAGRQEILTRVDVSRTVGWFSTIYPFVLEPGHGWNGSSPGAAIKAVKEQLRAVPRQGLGYGLLRYLSGDEVAEKLKCQPQAEVAFNYLGAAEDWIGESPLVALANGSRGIIESESRERAHMLEIRAWLADGQLLVSWSYSPSRHRQESIEAVAADYLENLWELIVHCQSEEAGGYTPSDFELARVTQEWLEQGEKQGWNIEDIYGLAPLQEGLLFHSMYAPQAGEYVVQLSYRVQGMVQVGPLQRAWRKVLERHPVLRSSFHWEDLEEPVQVVHRAVELPCTEQDWRGLSESEQRQRLAEDLEADRRRGFQLQEAPLMRMGLTRVTEQSYWFTWSFHHVLLDGWSMPRVLQEVFRFYEAESNGQQLELQPSRPYSAYIRWLRQQDTGRAEAYWRGRLAGFSEPTPLPLAGKAGEQSWDSGYAEETRRLTAEATQELRDFSRRQQVTVNTVFQAAWALLLSRYSGAEDVVYGTTVSGRPAELAGVEEMVGLFINTLPVRVELSAEQRVGEWLRRLQWEQVELRQFEYSSLAAVKGWSEVERGRSIFESIAVFENQPLETVLVEKNATETDGPVETEAVEVRNLQSVGWTNYPLTIVAVPGTELMVTIGYDRSRITEEQAKGIAGHYQRLLRALMSDGEQRLAQVEITTAAERRQLVEEWNETNGEYPQASLAELFARQVEGAPEAVALVFGDEEVSYAELNRRANQLAHYLREQGVGREALVGVMQERSVEMVVSLLAILKAGGAYVPLDANYPAERLEFMVRDAELKVLLTSERLREVLGLNAGEVEATTGCRVISVEREREEIGKQSEENPAVECGPEDLAYVIYTSGSTGAPKGVSVPQRAVTRLVCNTNFVALNNSARIAQASNASFDAFTFELWGALLHGGQLIGVSKEVALSPPEFALEIEQLGINVLFLTTALFNQIARSGPQAYAGLRYLLFGGEACDPHWISEVLEKGRPEHLLHVYGPTENTTFSTWYEVDSVAADATTVPIGGPITNTQCYVLNHDYQSVPLGVMGELYLGGKGLARNYLRRPELTAERFVPHPFSPEAGERLYRTGDLVRRWPKGEIEFVGRRDQQVKIRGFRVELGEIEAVLREHDAVRAAVVVVREDMPNDKRLVAYVVATQDRVSSPAELRKYLQERLPEYMAPTAFVQLTEIPLTANGKVDRRALPAPEHRRSATEEYVPPRTPVEKTLARIWSEVLRVDEVSIDDNFFELGGDSILSIQVISRANRKGIKLTPRQLFEQPTVAALARVAGTGQEIIAEQGVVTGEVFFTPIQHWFFEQQMIEPQHFNQAVMLGVRADLDLSLFEQAVNHLVAHHDALRLRFQPRAEGGWQQVNAEAEQQRIFDVRQIQAETTAGYASAVYDAATELQRSLDLEQGPLLRVAYFDLHEAGAGGRLLIVIHHLAVDGVSWRILLEDLRLAYEQLSRQEEVQLPAKTTSYQQWARQLVEHSASEDVVQELRYWTAPRWRLVKSLPVDFAGAENSRQSTGTVTVALNAEQTRALLQEVPQVYHTQINDLLLTALWQAFRKWSGEEKLLLDLEGHGREDISAQVDISRTVGWFTTIFPVLLEVRSPENVDSLQGAAIKTIKEQLREIPERGLGYGLLRYLHPDAAVRERLKAQASAEVSFNYLGQVDQVLDDQSLFSAAENVTGPNHSEAGTRVHLLEINSIIAGGQLQVNWSYSRNVHRQETIEALAEEYIDQLRRLIVHCQSPEAGGYTPSDFPLAQVTQEWLDDGARREWQIEDIYGLSPLQQGLLFHTLYAPEMGEYLVQLSYRIEGDFQMAVLDRAWRQLMERHAVLRSSLHWEGLEEPVQVVHEKVEFVLEQLDWRGVDEAEEEEWLAAELAADRSRGFELEKAPLMRVKLARVGEQSYWFMWSLHHLLMDGWSLPRLLKELLDLYDAHSRGRELRIEASRPYRDYIAWLRRQDMVQAEGYWRQRLAGFTEPTPLPLSRDRGSERSAEGYDSVQLNVGVAVTEQLRRYSRQQQVTMNTVVQATWALLLSRYSGEQDLVYGATVSGRPPELVGVEEMVGLFINTLPVRVQLSPEQMVGEWLRELQRRQVEMRQYEFSPLVEVQGWSEVGRTRTLFDSIVVFENYPLESVFAERGAELVEDQAEVAREAAVQISDVNTIEWSNYPLTLIATPGERLQLTFAYDVGWFVAEQLEQVARHYERLLESLVGNSGQALWQVQMLSAAEQQEIVSEWNQTRREYPAEVCLHELFEKQVERTPAATALVYGGERLSYQELNGRANQVGHYLQKRGVGPETLVGICMERSVELVVGLLGVLKAGGAYLPLDPANPVQRLALILEETQALVLLTQQSLVEQVPSLGDQTVCLERDWAEICGYPATRVTSSMVAEQLAYVIYTSGSTGRPKGVMIPHRAVVNYLSWCTEYYQAGAGQGSPMHTSISFDLTVTSLYAPLLSGGAVVLVNEEQGLAMLSSGIGGDEDYSLVKLTPAHLELLSRETEGKPVAGWSRVLVIGGEALAGESLQYWQEQAPGTRLINEYGPTETVVGCSIYEVKGGEKVEGWVPIGRPIGNVQIYILDGSGEVVAVGVNGEIVIGGDGLGRGYVGRAWETAERFVPDPYGGEAGRRLYRTGDVGRYRKDGELEYVGRRDEQVKMRGYRIELGEIEGVLRGHEGVREATVIMRAEESGEQRLVAYVVGAGEAGAVAVEELREYLQERLPEYMVPWAIVRLPELPLTANGKVDRRALPAPERSRVGAGYVGPRSPVEETVAAIWGKVLGVEKVGIHHNFFELGGHSLLATQVISRVRNVFGQEIGLRSLFEAPTVAGLAQRIEAAQRLGAGLLVPRLEKRAVREPVPLSYAQQRLWFLDQLEPGSSIYNVPLALRLEGELEVEALARSFSEVVRRHEVLRTSFGEVDGEAIQIIAAASEVRVVVTDLTELEGREQERQVQELAEAEANEAFDLGQGPLLRVQLLRLGAADHVLLLTMHHIVSDGWSLRVLTEEVVVLYEAYLAEEPSPLAELGIQYADYAVWQREWLQGEVLERELGYWKEHLRGAPAVLELPLDKPRPAVQSYRGAFARVLMGAELTQGLKAVSHQEKATLFMSLLAAYQVLLWRYSGESEVVVGTPIANRTQSETEALIGFFVNTLALRTHVSGELTWQELLGQVKEVCLGAYAHQDVPFEKLVDEIQTERNLSHSAVFQVMLVLQNASGGGQQQLAGPPQQLPGLRLSGIGTETHVAKFDLTLLMDETEEALYGVFEYNTDLFEAETIRRLAGHYERLLESLVGNSGQALWQAQMLSAAEQQEIVSEWNQTRREYPAEVCLHELFEKQVERTPAATALVFGGERLSYGELNRRANQLAHYLQKRGVGPETLVGICMERSVELVVGLLGVLKAGGAYLPLDPAYPAQRVSFMFADSQLGVVLTQQHLRPKLSGAEVELVVMDQEWALIGEESGGAVVSGVMAGNAAYVIYTSGSTGEPKAAINTHRAICNRLQWMQEAYELKAGDCVMQKTPYSFDVSVWEFFWPLLSGARMAVAIPGGHREVSYLRELIREEQVTVMHFVPSMLEQFVSEEEVGECESLRLVISSGEALSGSLVERFKERLGWVELENLYGPTEAAVDVSAWRCEGEKKGEVVPIGRPIANVQLYILGPEMELVTVGAVGEIYIGGVAVGRGYQERAEQTAERFVPDPYGGEAGRRLYRTGDVGRYRKDGELEYVGRRDEQVKMRGYRIELGEIEVVLRGHEGVREATVIMRAEESGEQRLVAYVVGAGEAGAVAVEELREYLQERLPEYMVPWAIVRLPELPLTTNGKVDRRALPAPERSRSGAGYVGPRSPVEETVAAIWGKVLGVEKVGIHHNFFELGGHSLLATQVISRVRNVFGQEIALRSLFEAPTVAGLAQRIEAAQRLGAGLQVPRLEKRAVREPVPLSYAQQRLWFLDQLEPGSSIYNVPLALRLEGELEVGALAQSFSEVVRRHEVLRTSFGEVDGEAIQIIGAASEVRVVVTDLTELEGGNRSGRCRS